MKLKAAILLLAAIFARADQWTFFHPESVRHMSCKVSMGTMSHGDSPASDMWIAEATAKRNDPSLGDWGMMVSERPLTTKGLHQAEKDCAKWMDEARKRVERAQGQ